MLTKSANLKESKKTSAFITNLWFGSCLSFTPHLEISLFGSKNTSLLQEVAWVECQICLLDINFPFYIFRDASERSDLDLHNDDVQFAGFASGGETAISKILFFSKNILEDSPFCGACFGLLVTSTLGFKVRVDPLVCVFHCLHASSDSHLVWHLLTCWQPAWQPSYSHPLTYEQALVGHETRIYHACCCLTVWDQADALPTKLCWLGFFPKIFFPR